jgi:prepilin-type N-terminal cleavage/methylation domain-containing protein
LRHEGPGNAGFTLLETLVSLVVVGLILSGLAQGFRFGIAAWDAQARLLASGGDLDSVAGAHGVGGKACS